MTMSAPTLEQQLVRIRLAVAQGHRLVLLVHEMPAAGGDLAEVVAGMEVRVRPSLVRHGELIVLDVTEMQRATATGLRQRLFP